MDGLQEMLVMVVRNNMIIFYCYRCGKKGEFETKKEMKCDCGHYVNKKRNRTGNHINMRKTWSGTTKVEFGTTTLEESMKKMRNN